MIKFLKLEEEEKCETLRSFKGATSLNGLRPWLSRTHTLPHTLLSHFLDLLVAWDSILEFELCIMTGKPSLKNQSTERVSSRIVRNKKAKYVHGACYIFR